MVKRVFITSEFGDNGLPKWISWLRAIVDADDLPLNVSRETLQSTRFLKQVKQVLINRAIALLAKISEEDPKKYKEIIEIYGPALKLGAVESAKDRQKIVGLTRWTTNLRNFTTLDEVLWLTLSSHQSVRLRLLILINIRAIFSMSLDRRSQEEGPEPRKWI